MHKRGDKVTYDGIVSRARVRVLNRSLRGYCVIKFRDGSVLQVNERLLSK
jgi:hypothetical protein